MIVIEPPEPGASANLFASLRKPEVRRFLKRAQTMVGLAGEVNLLLTDDTRIRTLNKIYRGKNKATDVLSFPAAANGEGVAGDLAISVDTAHHQAEEHGHSLDVEVQVLTLHGLLHLAGYDHETDSGEMLKLEIELRQKLNLPSGLIERVYPSKKSKDRLAPSAKKLKGKS